MERDSHQDIMYHCSFINQSRPSPGGVFRYPLFVGRLTTRSHKQHGGSSEGPRRGVVIGCLNLFPDYNSAFSESLNVLLLRNLFLTLVFFQRVDGGDDASKYKSQNKVEPVAALLCWDLTVNHQRPVQSFL